MARQQKFPHLLGSKWTACHPTEGWRHFQVANRKQQGTWLFAELVAACDPTVRFWINAQQLKNRTLWQPGWQPLGPASPPRSLEES
ncbi:MAG TPA: TIGR02450 family Trp-rich protein [Leptolyngbyaceae cyanobacterium M65_K2018_010]|nr:TIGR02450 family Trp-rich protein [Leptolyngbyaceae cyanobacterium M65_K2018_010]